MNSVVRTPSHAWITVNVIIFSMDQTKSNTKHS